MKRIVFLLLLVLGAFTISACNGQMTYECEPKTAWNYDETSHWHDCVIPSCEDRIDEEEHSFGEWYSLEEGFKQRDCEICDYVEETEIEEGEHFHHYSEEYEFNETKHWFECSCGDKKEEVDHDWNVIEITKPTNTTPGKAGYTCKVCGYSEQREIPATDHTHQPAADWSKDSDYHWHECSGCDIKLDNAVHTWDNGVETKPATETETGIKVFTCTACGQTKEETTPVLGHVHSYTELKSDSTGHWNACSCGEPDKVVAHEYGAWIDKENKQENTCSVCNYIESRDITDVWGGSAISDGLAGEGTEEKPYEIHSGADLAYFRDNVASFAGKYVKLMRNIDLNNANFIIGSFAGTFDGNNYSILNLALVNTGTEIPTGFIGNLEATGAVKNLSVYGTANAEWSTAGIVGISAGSITNCKNYVNVTSKWDVGGVVALSTGPVLNCENHGSVTGDSNVGGVVGWASGTAATVTGCTNFGAIIGSNDTGGVVAESDAVISGCKNYGAVKGINNVGGVVSYMKNNITDSHNYKNDNAEINGEVRVGGVVGYAEGVAATVTGCTNSGKVTGHYETAGVVAKSDAVVSNCTNSGIIIGYYNTGGVIGLAYNNVSNCHNTAVITGGAYLNLSEWWEAPCGGVVGFFQGEKMETCTNTGEIKGKNLAGGIVGKVWREGTAATISDCTNEGFINCTQFNIGGIFGSIDNATATNCINKGDLYSKADPIGGIAGAVYSGGKLVECHNHGKVDGWTKIAGIVGNNEGTISNCDNYGKVTVNPDNTDSPIFGAIYAINTGTVEDTCEDLSSAS